MVLSTALLTTASLSFLIIAILGSFGNLLTAIALGTGRNRSRFTTILVINLSLSILPICILTMPFLSALCFKKLYSELVINEGAIKGFYILTTICNQVELHTVTVLAINRACAVVSPAFYKSYMHKTILIRSSIVFIWVYSILLWTPLAFGIFGYMKVDPESFVKVVDETNIKVGIQITLCYVLPFLVTIACHVVMLCKFRRTRVFRPDGNTRRPWENQVTRTMTAVFLLLILVTVPHFIAHYLRRTGEYPKSWVLLHILYFSRFCLNPFVYVFTSIRYKEECLRTIHSILKCCRIRNTRSQTKNGKAGIKVAAENKDKTISSNEKITEDL